MCFYFEEDEAIVEVDEGTLASKPLAAVAAVGYEKARFSVWCSVTFHVENSIKQ